MSSFRKFRKSLWRKNIAVIEDYQNYYSTRNGCIGKVENRLKEKELLSADKWYP